MSAKRTLPKHVYFQADQSTGKNRLRFRRKINNKWQSAYLPGPVYSEEFNQAYHALLEQTEIPKKQLGSSNTIPGTMNATIVAWYQSAGFKALKPSTKVTYRRIAEKLRNKTGNEKIHSLTRIKIQKVIDRMSDRPTAANRLISILRLICANAIQIGLIKENPAIDVKGYSRKTNGFHTWTDGELAQFREHWPIGTRERLAFELMLGTASRRSDAVRLGWQHLQNGFIRIVQQKTGAQVDLPVPEELKACLEDLGRNNMTFLVTKHGKPFSDKGFGNWFKQACISAGLPHCTSHGLRKAMSRLLAEAGATAMEIKSITGHSSMKEVEVYTRAAEQKRLAKAAFDRLQSTKVEQIVSQNQERLGKNRN